MQSGLSSLKGRFSFMMPAMAKSRAGVPNPVTGLLLWLPAALLIVLSGSVMLSMVAQTPALFETRTKIADAKVRVEDADREVQRLRAAREYARSEAFTERWARTQARWARPGESTIGISLPGARDRDWLEDFRLD
jgi:hypothetical protein